MPRVRAPSSRALAIARDSLEASTPPPSSVPRSRKTSQKATSAKSRKPNKGKGEQVVVEEVSDDDSMGLEKDEEEEEEEEQEPDSTLYCICLGIDTGEQPMIQCEHCSNWFHFTCIGLNESSAQEIEAYCCDLCEQMGADKTRYITSVSKTVSKKKSAQPPPLLEFKDDPDVPSDSTNSEDEDDLPDTDDEAFEGETSLSKKKTKKSAGVKRKVAALVEEDEEYVGDEEREANKSRKIPSKPRRRESYVSESSPPAKARARKPVATSTPSTPSSTSVPTSDRTRAHCITTLTTLFTSIFSATVIEGSELDPRIAIFASAVEEEVFSTFGETDAKGIKGPRVKYVAKFRTLTYNLKSNAFLRSRINANEFEPAQIVNLTNEDLLTPELRAMAESVRAASLKHSVKEVLAAPTAKRTHKGEEEIDNYAAGNVAAEERALQHREAVEREKAMSRTPRDRSDSFSGETSSPKVDSFTFASPSTSAKNLREDSPPFAALAKARQNSTSQLIVPDDVDLGAEFASPTTYTTTTPASVPIDTSDSFSMPPPPAPSARPRTSFDMASVWGNIKVSATPKETEEQDAAPSSDPMDETHSDDDYDSTLPDHMARSSASKSTTPPLPTPSATPLSELAPIWAGDLIVPEEGGFPAFGVQVGGRKFGSATEVWNQLMPKSLTMSGRIPSQVASKYLVECSFAATRELVVVALLPDLTGPNEWFPAKPVADSCLAKHAHVINFYVTKDRIGVISPPEALRRVVKDVYIIPLKKEEQLPEYVELLDDHNVPETGTRDQDLLLCVLVVQKGALPTISTRPPPPLQIPPLSTVSHQAVPAPQSAIPQSYSQQLPSVLPTSAPPLTFDPAALASLLQNPADLTALLSNPLLQSMLNPSSSATPPIVTSSGLDEVLAGLTGVGMPPAEGRPQETSYGGAVIDRRQDYRGADRGNSSGYYSNEASRDNRYQGSPDPADGRGSNTPQSTGTPTSPPRKSFMHPSRMPFLAGGGSPERSGRDYDNRGGAGGSRDGRGYGNQRDDNNQRDNDYRNDRDDRGGRGGSRGGGRGGRGGGSPEFGRGSDGGGRGRGDARRY